MDSSNELGFLEWLQKNNPNGAEEMSNLGTLDERSELLKQQLAQANALRGRTGQKFRTPWGAGLNMVGDLARQLGGGIQANRAQEGQEALLNQKDKGRLLHQKLLSQYLAAMQPASPGTPKLLQRPPEDGVPYGYGG